MAAPKIRLRRSATAGNAPTTSQIELGEVAINTNDGKLFLKKDDGTERIVDVTAYQETKEPMGLNDPSETTISFDNNTRIFSVAPTASRFDVWYQSVRYVFTTTQTVTIPNTTGLYYFYFGANATLTYRTPSTDPNYDAEVRVATGYYNATLGEMVFLYATKHGIVLDWATYEYLQNTRGPAIKDGFPVLYAFEDGDGSLDRHAQVGIDEGTFYNEDYIVTITNSSPSAATNPNEQELGDSNNPGKFPVMYRSGSGGPWVIDTATEYAFKTTGTGLLEYNLNTSGTWSSTAVTSGNYAVMYLVATSDADNPVVAVMGHDEYATFPEARTGSGFENLDLGNFPGPEQTPIKDLRLLYTLIFQVNSSYTNAKKARLIEYVDERTRIISQLVGGREAVITDHGILTGLDDDDHFQYVHVSNNRNISADHTITSAGSIRFDGSILDNTGSAGVDNYALLSKNVGGTQTTLWDWAKTRPEENIVYVSKDGNDSNSGLTPGQAKLTIKAAAEGASEGTVIRVFAGNYTENNPIVLPKQVSVVGSSLREVSVSPSNVDDLFYVTNGSYISDMSFTSTTANSGAIVAFNPSDPPYIDQSPYIQNCTNFIEDSTGLRINGDDCIGDIKSMVVDSFTQFNPNGFGAKITNEAYAQLVSMFTICCDTAILCQDGGGCDLTNSNSSFGINGIIADGVSPLKYTGLVSQAAAEADTTIRIDISTPSLDITNAVYNNNTGVVTVTTSTTHNYTVGMDVQLNNILFECNSGAHTFVSATSTAITDTTGGGSTTIGPVTDADYTTATGVLELTIASHGLTTGDTIQIAQESLTFTCESDGNQTQLSHPRTTDPAFGQNLSVTVTGTDTFTVNVGSFAVTQLFPSGAYGNVFKVETVPTTTTFTVNVGTNNLTHTYKPAEHQFQSADTNAVTIVSGGTGSLTPTDATYEPSTGVLTLTIASHGLSNGDEISLVDDSLTFKCSSDNFTDNFTYPRSTDPASTNTAALNNGVLAISNATTDTFEVQVGTTNISGFTKIDIIRPYAGQVVYFDTLYYEVIRINVTNGGSGYDPLNPPVVTIPSSPESWGIDASALAVVSNTGVVTAVDVVSSGRGYGSTPPSITIDAPGTGTTATATAELTPSYFIVESTLEVGTGNDEYDVTFSNETPIALAVNDVAYFFKQSRLLASSHSFQYIGSGVDITTALPQTGGVPTPETETISKNGGLVVYTSTNETGNFNIGDGVQINQALGRFSGTAYSQSLFATVTPFILALGG